MRLLPVLALLLCLASGCQRDPESYASPKDLLDKMPEAYHPAPHWTPDKIAEANAWLDRQVGKTIWFHVKVPPDAPDELSPQPEGFELRTQEISYGQPYRVALVTKLSDPASLALSPESPGMHHVSGKLADVSISEGDATGSGLYLKVENAAPFR